MDARVTHPQHAVLLYCVDISGRGISAYLTDINVQTVKVLVLWVQRSIIMQGCYW
jgi:hypothetical protein